jgi:hypothetical protein
VTPPMRWLALLASGGAVAGGAAALNHAPPLASPATTKPSVALVHAATSTKDAAEIRMLISETNSLQGALFNARQELVRVLSHPGSKTIIDKTIYKTIYKTTTKSVLMPSGPSAALTTAIASEQAALRTERARLQAEATQLGSGARTLLERQTLLTKEQVQLAKEASALAVEAKKLAHPTTHGTTGASSGAGTGQGHDD